MIVAQALGVPGVCGGQELKLFYDGHEHILVAN